MRALLRASTDIAGLLDPWDVSSAAAAARAQAAVERQVRAGGASGFFPERNAAAASAAADECPESSVAAADGGRALSGAAAGPGPGSAPPCADVSPVAPSATTGSARLLPSAFAVFRSPLAAAAAAATFRMCNGLHFCAEPAPPPACVCWWALRLGPERRRGREVALDLLLWAFIVLGLAPVTFIAGLANLSSLGPCSSHALGIPFPSHLALCCSFTTAVADHALCPESRRRGVGAGRGHDEPRRS